MATSGVWSVARSLAGRRPRFESQRGTAMTGRTLKIAAVCMALFAVILVNNRLGLVQGQLKKTPGEGFAAVPGLKGGQDVFGLTIPCRAGGSRCRMAFAPIRGRHG